MDHEKKLAGGNSTSHTDAGNTMRPLTVHDLNALPIKPFETTNSPTPTPLPGSPGPSPIGGPISGGPGAGTPVGGSPGYGAPSGPVQASFRSPTSPSPSASTGNHVIDPRPDNTDTGGHNNPGNIKSTVWMENSLGETGPLGTIGNFPSEAQGRYALGSLMDGTVYGPMSVNDAITRYAPAGDHNNVSAYQADVDSYIQSSGANGNTIINSMTNSQFNTFLDAITHHEGETATGGSS